MDTEAKRLCRKCNGCQVTGEPKKSLCIEWFYSVDPGKIVHVKSCDPRAANSVDFCIEFKFEFSLFCEFKFEFDIFIFASSSSNSSPVKIYQVLSSSENKVIDSA